MLTRSHGHVASLDTSVQLLLHHRQVCVRVSGVVAAAACPVHACVLALRPCVALKALTPTSDNAHCVRQANNTTQQSREWC